MPGSSYYDNATAKFENYGSLQGGASPGNPRYYTWKYYDREISTTPRPDQPFWIDDPLVINVRKPRPLRLPQFIPMDKPILKPDAPPLPLPWPLIPNRNPDPMPEGSERGYDLPDVNDRQEYTPPNLRPPERLNPETPIFLHVNPPRRPPEDREKEKKFGGSSDAVQQFFRNVSRFKESVTELKDMLEAIHKAIDKKTLKKLKDARGKGYKATPQSLAKDIYDHFDKIDWEKALDNVVENWAEDKVMGTAIRAGDLASKRLGLKSTLQGRGWMPRW